jgi:hypothetical protein
LSFYSHCLRATAVTTKRMKSTAQTKPKRKKYKKRNNKPKKFLRPTRRRETEIVQHKEVVKVEKREKSII